MSDSSGATPPVESKEASIPGPKTCRACGTALLIRLMETGPHHARLDCPSCGRFDSWAPKPEADRARRPAAHRDLVRRFSRGYCELCLRPEAELPRGATLHGHHVDEFQGGGEPIRENIWILCTACHALVTWIRTYLGQHAREAR